MGKHQPAFEMGNRRHCDKHGDHTDWIVHKKSKRSVVCVPCMKERRRKINLDYNASQVRRMYGKDEEIRYRNLVGEGRVIRLNNFKPATLYEKEKAENSRCTSKQSFSS